MHQALLCAGEILFYAGSFVLLQTVSCLLVYRLLLRKHMESKCQFLPLEQRACQYQKPEFPMPPECKFLRQDVTCEFHEPLPSEPCKFAPPEIPPCNFQASEPCNFRPSPPETDLSPVLSAIEALRSAKFPEVNGLRPLHETHCQIIDASGCAVAHHPPDSAEVKAALATKGLKVRYPDGTVAWGE